MIGLLDFRHLGGLALFSLALALLGLTDLPPVVLKTRRLRSLMYVPLAASLMMKGSGGDRGEQLERQFGSGGGHRNWPGFSMSGILSSRASSGVA